MLPQNVPPPLPARDSKNADHLQLVAVFHYVIAGFAVFGIGGLVLHYLFMSTVFANPQMWENAKSGPPPAEFLAILKWFYLFFGIVTVTAGFINAVSARLIQKRRGRMFSMVIAGLNCLQFPFGTALGVFTFIVLLRPSVQRLYDQAPTDAAGRGGEFR